MMYALGLRVGEVSRLRLRDVDFERRVLRLRKTKSAKDRFIPFGPRLGTALARYISEFECRSDKHPGGTALFSFRIGRPVSAGTIAQTFHHLVTSHPEFAPPPGVSRPTPHSLRHSFAVGTLLRWYRAGTDVSERLIHFSTFLGHVDPESTAWYLTITAELLEQASQLPRLKTSTSASGAPVSGISSTTCVFRRIPITDSGLIRSLIPAQTDHRFRR